MWTNENRARYDRSHLRYPSDLSDDEWKLVEPLIPPGKRGGDKRTVIMREVVNGLMYILSTGCQWRAIPKDLPPRSTLYDYFDLWSWDGTLDRIHHELYVKCREAIGREASLTAAVIDRSLFWLNRAVMTKTFKIGDRVSWNSEAGRVSGTVIRVHTHNIDHKGYTHHAREHDLEEYEIERLSQRRLGGDLKTTQLA
jgi:transposase